MYKKRKMLHLACELKKSSYLGKKSHQVIIKKKNVWALQLEVKSAFVWDYF